MKHIEGTFRGARKASIYYQAWLPDQVRAAVVIAHGLGEHGGRYAEVAGKLVELGCAVYAIDHRGHGKSDGARAFIDRLSWVVDDLDQLVDLVRREQRIIAKKKPLFLLGHSMGGAIALSYALRHQDKLGALILSGPAVALDGASPLMRAMSKLVSRLAPKAGVLKIDASKVSRDPQMVALYDSDPLNCHGKVPARTIGELVTFVEWLPAVLPQVTLPLLVMHGSADSLAGPAGGKMVVDRARSTDKSYKLYDGLYHEIFNELPEDRARVFADLTSWVQARLPA